MGNEIRVVVQSIELANEKVFAGNGKTYGSQYAAIFTGGPFPVPFKVNVEKGHEYPPGDYTIAPGSFITDEMGNLKLKSIKLLPLGGSSASAKAR